MKTAMHNALSTAATLAFTALSLHAEPAKAPVPIGDTPAVSRLAQAITAYDKRDFFTTVHLLSAPGQPVKLRDYVAYYAANAELMTNNGEDAVRDLGKYTANPVSGSPLAGRIVLLYAKALLGQHTPTLNATSKARQILETDYALLPQPDGDFTLGQAFEATGFPRQAVVYYQKVYYSHPTSDLSDKAKAAFDRLRATLGGEYPEATPRQQLERANAFLTAKQYLKARQEFIALSSQLAGGDRDQAQAGIGAAFFLNNEYANTVSYLAPLHPEGNTPASAEGAAERLYYLTESYRHLNDDSSMLEAVKELGDKYPQSPWRLKALITAGNRYLLTQDRAQYVPLYLAAANSFPGDSNAALCHWRVAWAAWLDHSTTRVELLRQQIEKFPSDTHVSDALFFLGRAAEQDSALPAARAYYARLDRFYPHYYYSGLARTRLADPKLASVKEDPAIHDWLQKTGDTARNSVVSAEIVASANEATRQRIDRGRMLIAAGLTTQAVEELEYGAKQTGEQPTLLAMELSRAMPTPYLAVKVMKKFSGDYLSLPFDKASRAFWQMLFPLPYQDSLTASSTARDLDPYAVAGLIRQESEFNPVAKSAFAYGLMQLRPGTGKDLGRVDGIKISSAGMLFDPGLNIKLGTQYLRTELNQWEGDWVKTLAAYNAGPGRVKEWLNQYGYSDSAEFIENIPFSETRDYVQAVLRNGQVYRELYGKDKAQLASDVADTSTEPPARITNLVLASKVIPKPAPKTVVKTAHRPAPKTAAKTHKSTKPASTAKKGTGSSAKKRAA